VRLTDGAVLTLPAGGAQGHPDEPLSDDALREKFLGCAATALPHDEAEGIADQIARIDDLPDVRALTSRLRGTLD
jgi:hypothetical protein